LDVLPFHLLVEKLTHRAATRLATLPQSHPLEMHVTQAVNRYVKHHHALLHEILHAFRIHPAEYESIKPCTRGLKHMHTFTTHIPGSKEEAKLEAVADRSEVSVFSDRSGHEGGIGALAVLYRGRAEKRMLRKFMGSEETHTVFEAEVLGLSLAMEMLKGETLVQSLTIGVNSQAVMWATWHRSTTPGQYLIEMFHRQITAIQGKHPGIEITLRWTPGHAGIPGNERADEEAKWVAKGQSSAQSRLPAACRNKLPLSQSAAHQTHRKRVNEKVKKWFKSSPRCQRLQGIDPTMPSPRFMKDTQGLEH